MIHGLSMNPDDMGILGTLREVMSYHNSRQRVLAENVANANTPGFTPSDISRSEFERVLNGQRSAQGFQMSTTEPGHIKIRTAGDMTFKASESPDSETTVNGNSVVIEEQMVRASDNRIKYETALALYQKSLGLIRMAAKAPSP